LNCAPTVAVSACVQAGPYLALLLLQSMCTVPQFMRKPAAAATTLSYISLSLSLSLSHHTLRFSP
jgi:hypothetical protein